MIESLPNRLRSLRRHPRMTGLVLALVVGSAVAGAFFWRQYHLRAAHQALDRFALDDAQHHLDLCLQVPYHRSPIHLLAARTARRRDAYREAERHLAACEQKEGRTEAFVLEQLLLLAQQGELEGVERSLQARASNNDAEAVLALEALAKGYVNRFWRPDALECLNKLLQRQPEHPQALLMRARLLEDLARKGQVEREADALRDYEKAVEVNPSFEARLGLAGALYSIGRPWDALLEYQRLHPLRESDADVLLGLARCHYNLDEGEEAVRLLEELLQRYPDNRSALLERGRLALHKGEPAEAEKWLRRAVDLAPVCDTEPLRSLVQCLESQHKEEDYRHYLDRLHRYEVELLRLDRLTLQVNRDLSQAAPGPNSAANTTDLGDRMMSLSRMSNLHYEIATDLIRLGREQDGVAALYFILDVQPHYAPAHAALADYFERTGQSDRAARHRRAAAKNTAAR